MKFLITPIAVIILTVLTVFPTGQTHASILDIQTVKTEKNITAWLVEDQTVPVISMKFSFKGAGSINDPDDKQGVSQLLSNTLDEGAGDLSAKEFQAALNDNSISLSFSSSRDNFGGSLKTLVKYQDTAFDLLRLSLTQPLFEKDALRRMKESNIARIKSNMSDPEWLEARLANATLFKNHPYARNSGGTLSSLPKITAQDLHQKLKGQLGRDRLIIAVAGNISATDLARRLDEVFGDLPETSQVVPMTEAQFPDGELIVQHVKEIPQTVIGRAYPGISIKSPDYFKAEILNYILGGAGFGSRLTESIREQRGLTYGIFSDLSELDYANMLTIGTSTRSEKVDEVLSLIDEETLKLANEQVTPQELAEAKSYLVGSVPLGLTSTDGIAAMMMGFQSYSLPQNYLDIRDEGIKAATRKDVLDSAKVLLDQKKKVTILVGRALENRPVQFVEKLPDIQ